MLVGSRRGVVTSAARYRAVSESTATASDDDEDERLADDDHVGGLAGDGSYESFGTCGTCDLLLPSADEMTTSSTRSRPPTGIQELTAAASPLL